MNGSTQTQAPLRALPPGAHIHLIGAAGAGMNALAAVLLARGYRLSGSDMQRSAQVDRLIGQGLLFYQGHDPVQVHGADLVLISAAVGEQNVELAAARAAGIPVVKRAAALGWLLEDLQTIAVAGTHGKTTTSSLLAVVLHHAGLQPTFVVGGEVLDLGASAQWGTGAWAVVEADEYDRSFLQLRPSIAIITNVEPDHLEYYGSLAALHEAFEQFVALIRPHGVLVINAADPYLRSMTLPPGLHVIRCAVEPPREALNDLDWYARNIESHAEGTRFLIERGGTAAESYALELRLSGRHNVANALQAFAAAVAAGISPAAFSAAAATFRGAGRRFERVGEERGVLVVDDYAHHPTEVRANLAAARLRFAGRRLVVVFQPHTYSRTNLLFAEFVAAFDAADQLVLTDIYAARETDTLGMDAAQLCAAIAARPGGPPVQLVRDLAQVAEVLVPQLQAGDVVLTLGAGTITVLGPRLLAALRENDG